jgi:antitoxin component of MazEF toxin-antitoxin module
MLKRLVKYGNSTTLVLDKAILELLNMNESGKVRLRTDGQSLIITPVEVEDKDKKVSYEKEEGLHVAAHEARTWMRKGLEVELPKEKQEIIDSLKKEFSEIFAKRNKALVKFSHEIFPSDNFQQAISELNEKIDPQEQNKDYLLAYNNLMVQFCPELGDLQKEIDLISKQYATLDSGQTE